MAEWSKTLMSQIQFEDKDQTSTKELLEKTGFLSVNQTAASFKLTEVWKGLNIRFSCRLSYKTKFCRFICKTFNVFMSGDLTGLCLFMIVPFADSYFFDFAKCSTII